MMIRSLAMVVAAAALLVPASAQEPERENPGAPTTAAPQRVEARESIHQEWRDFQPRFAPGACPFEGDFDREIISCGSVMVPEDRRDPDSNLIRLAVMRIAPLADAPEGNAIVRLTGGPGIAALAGGRAEYFSGKQGETLRRLGEIVYFDQRGTGVSERNFCRGIPQFFQHGAIPSAEGHERTEAMMADCLAEARREGIAVEAYDNWSNALDVRDLRRALGYQQWNLLGVSYGTQLGQGVMAVDPEGVRSAVLDSVVPNSGMPSMTGSTGVNFEQSLEAVQAACAAQDACSRAFPDLAERVYRVIESFGEQPLVIGGLTPPAFPRGSVMLDDVAAAQLLFQLLYSRALYGELPIILEAMETRNIEALRIYAQQGAPGYDRTYGSGMNRVILCSDGKTKSDAENAVLHQDAPRSEPWFAEAGVIGCGGQLTLDIDPTARPLVSDIPTLIVAGDADPITPWQESRWLADRLEKATYVEFAGTGHGALFSNGACGDAILADFIEDPERELDTACVEEIDPIDFATDWRSTDAPFRMVSAVQAGRWPWGLALALVGVVGAVLFFPAAALGRRVEARRGRTVTGGLARARWASWGGAALGLAAAASAGWIVQGWLATHPMGLPVGVPNSVAVAGLLALAGVVLAVFGALWAWRARDLAPTGTLVATLVSVVATAGLLAAMTAHGLGPILL
ncbi:alpha/beta fold hydrolase [Sphingomicrobium sp. XHP0235]|uniref:alpha/beta fold hydrolase n=1 Tax=Sphingomicrobium aquimarinum TaxID=3133971 RepID=UPI0031FF1226